MSANRNSQIFIGFIKSLRVTIPDEELEEEEYDLLVKNGFGKSEHQALTVLQSSISQLIALQATFSRQMREFIELATSFMSIDNDQEKLAGNYLNLQVNFNLIDNTYEHIGNMGNLLRKIIVKCRAVMPAESPDYVNERQAINKVQENYEALFVLYELNVKLFEQVEDWNKACKAKAMELGIVTASVPLTVDSLEVKQSAAPPATLFARTADSTPGSSVAPTPAGSRRGSQADIATPVNFFEAPARLRGQSAAVRTETKPEVKPEAKKTGCCTIL